MDQQKIERAIYEETQRMLQTPQVGLAKTLAAIAQREVDAAGLSDELACWIAGRLEPMVAAIRGAFETFPKPPSGSYQDRLKAATIVIRLACRTYETIIPTIVLRAEKSHGKD